MSTGLVIAIVVIAAVVFGAIVVLTTARSTEVRGAGSLSRETRSRDRKTTIGEDASTGREVEAAARSTEIVKAAPVLQPHCSHFDGCQHRRIRCVRCCVLVEGR